MFPSALVTVQFRLQGAGTSRADVTLMSFGDRWMARATIAGEPQIGLGRNAREALAGALAVLGQRAASLLLVDPGLLAVSLEIARQEQRLGA
jgi:hypothetical protein